MRAQLKKLFSGILAVVMLVSLTPTALAAKEPDQATQEEALKQADGQVTLINSFYDGTSLVSNDLKTELRGNIKDYYVTQGTIQMDETSDRYYPGVEYGNTFSIPKPKTVTTNENGIPYLTSKNGEVFLLKGITYTACTESTWKLNKYLQTETTTNIDLSGTWPTNSLTHYKGVLSGTATALTVAYSYITYKWEKQTSNTQVEPCIISFELSNGLPEINPSTDSITIRYATSNDDEKVTDIKYESVRTLSTAENDLTDITVPQGWTFNLYPGSRGYYDDVNKTLFATVKKKVTTEAQTPGDTTPAEYETTYYVFRGWKTSADADDVYNYSDEIKAPTTSTMTLSAVWEKIDLAAVEKQIKEDGAPEIILATNNNSATVEQHNGDGNWTSEPIQLGEDRLVYYRASMKMHENVALLLGGREINTSNFAHFDIAVNLDQNLRLQKNADGSVSFTFTCAFLKPDTKLIVTKDGEEETVNTTVTSGTSGDTTKHTITVSSAASLTDDEGHVYPFVIPVDWYMKDQNKISYTEKELLSEIKLEMVTATADENVNKVISGGQITGQINFEEVLGENEFLHLVGYLTKLDLLQDSYYASGAEGVARVLLLADAVREASQDINLGANTVCAQVGKGEPVVPGNDDPKPDISKSASKLTNDTTDVTLSIGAKTSKTASDVVFVLDKSTSADVRTAAKEMLAELNDCTADNTIKVGVVIFNKTYNRVLELTELNEKTLSTIQNAIDTPVSDNTNMQAGLIGGKQMLDEDTTVSADAKHLVFVSDGITYVWNDSTLQTATQMSVYDEYASNNEECLYIGPEDWIKHHTDTTNALAALSNPKQWMAANKDSFEATMTQYADTYEQGQYKKEDYPEYLSLKKYIPADQITNTGHATDFAMYKAAEVYQELIKEGYHCYSYFGGQDTGTANQVAEQYPWAYAFMTNLSKIGGISGVVPENVTGMFDNVKSVILNEIQSGTITDVIGADFTLTDKTITKDTFTLTANGEKYAANDPNGNTVSFGAADTNGVYPFVLTYYHGTATKNDDGTYTITSGNVSYQYTSANTASVVNGGASDEFFVLQMNIPVVSLELKYNLTLSDKQTAYGTYTVPTNETAVLVYQPTDSSTEYTLEYNEPTVSYTVRKPSNPSTPVTPPPALNTEDHFAYIIGYPVDYYTGEPTDDQTKKPVKPEGNITRAEVATIFFRLLTDETRNEFWSQTSSYGDVSIDAWYNNAICTLSNAGILKGYEDGSFRPNGNITRAEFATIAVRFFETEYNGADLFPDIDKHWARDYINQAASAGLVAGYPDGTFGPDKLITRAEAVTIVNRTIDRHPDVEHLLDDMLVWPDNMDTTKWYYADMQEATNSHEYTMNTKKDETKFEIWQKILPVRDWEAFEKAWADANAAANPGEVVR